MASKLRVNYDLINRIKVANTGFDSKQVINSRATNLALSFPFILPLYYINPTLESFSLISSIYLVEQGLFTLVDVAIQKIKKEYNMQDANFDLMLLSCFLLELEVKTTEELLKEAQVIQTDYEICKDGKIPVIKQKKYISVPLTNGYEESLLQEHIIGNKYYDITVEEPKKQENFRLVKQLT